MGPGEIDLAADRRALDIQDIGLDTITPLIALAGDLLPLGQDGLGPPEIHIEIAPLDPLDKAGDHLPLSVLILVVGRLPLRIPDPLHDDLLGRLGGDPAQVLDAQFDPQTVSDLRLGVHPLGLDGSVDVLVNIALCKGHSMRFGGFTMAMKNHFGTFSPRPGHQEGSEDYLIAINKTPEILGTMHKRTGKVLYPRQQLCLVDALWASRGGPGGNPSHQPNFLAMGVLAPVVDYQLATKFRSERMGWELNREMTRRMLTEFGYTEADLPGGGKLIEV